MSLPEVLTLREVAQVLRCSKAHICKIVNGQVAARKKLDGILSELKQSGNAVTTNMSLGQFIESVYYPFYTRKWKGSTAVNNISRVNTHVVGAFGPSQGQGVPPGRAARLSRRETRPARPIKRRLRFRAGSGVSCFV